jgi:hypothetical protein
MQLQPSMHETEVVLPTPHRMSHVAPHIISQEFFGASPPPHAANAIRIAARTGHRIILLISSSFDADPVQSGCRRSAARILADSGAVTGDRPAGLA